MGEPPSPERGSPTSPASPASRPRPRRSGRCYLRLAGKDVAMAKFELEAFGHLGVLSVLDRWDSVAVVTYAPGMGAMLEKYLESLRELVEFEVLYRSPA